MLTSPQPLNSIGRGSSCLPTRYRSTAALLLVSLLACSGCAARIPAAALQLGAQSLEMRRLQTRRFDTLNEETMLAATAGLLQDLGFSLDESETDLGVIVASKERSAVETGQVVAAVFLAALTGVATPIDQTQRMRASIVTRPLQETEQVSVRVTFQRIVWNDRNQITKLEALSEPEMYQQFFTQLSKAVFLEAHSI